MQERPKVTYLFDARPARGEFPLGDGWFPHTDFRSEREHSRGRSLGGEQKYIKKVGHQEEKSRPRYQFCPLPWTEVATLWQMGMSGQEVRAGRVEVE